MTGDWDPEVVDATSATVQPAATPVDPAETPAGAEDQFLLVLDHLGVPVLGHSHSHYRRMPPARCENRLPRSTRPARIVCVERVATKGNVIAVANLGELAVQVCGREWDDETWREYCEMIVGYVRRFGVPRVLFNFAPYHGPNASQRQILVEEYAERIGLHRIRRNALISDSRVVRGVMIALSGLSPEERARARTGRS